MSAYVSQALERWDADERLARMLAKMHAEGGSPTTADRDWARHELGLDDPEEMLWSLVG